MPIYLHLNSQVNFDFDQKLPDQRMEMYTIVSESILSKTGRAAIRLAYLVSMVEVFIFHFAIRKKLIFPLNRVYIARS